MTDNGSSGRWNWLLIALVILALAAIIVAVTLSQPTGSKSTLTQRELDQLVTDVQARLQAWNQQLTDLRSRAEKSRVTDPIGEIAQPGGMIAGIEGNLVSLQSGTAGAWEAPWSRFEAGMAEVDDFFQQLGDRLGSGFPTFESRAQRVGVSLTAFRSKAEVHHAGVAFAGAALHGSA